MNLYSFLMFGIVFVSVVEGSEECLWAVGQLVCSLDPKQAEFVTIRLVDEDMPRRICFRI